MSTAGATVAATAPKPWFGDRGRRVLWVAIAALSVLVVLSLAVFPVRQYLGQRADTAARQHVLDQLLAENAKLQGRVDALSTPEEIERIARAEYSLVKPGEETYAILPPKRAASSVPAVWPFGE
jgi:cell division protein FtsB